MSRFQTLMRREWLQHRLGWLATMFAPPSIVLLLLLLLGVGQVGLPPSVSPLLVVLGTAAVGAFGGLAIFSVVTWLQLPGLARRDAQDRSIEFWLSLPVGHAASVGAPLVMHLLVMPLAALGVGFAFGQIFGLVAVAKLAGAAAWTALPWPLLLRDELVALASFGFGSVVATFWLLPLWLLTMAASAWLKRWGAALLVVALTFGHAVLLRLYGIAVVGDTLRALVAEATRAVFNDHDARLSPRDAGSALAWLRDSPGWLWQDAVEVAGRLLQPLALVALAISAACFGLLVLRRRRSG